MINYAYRAVDDNGRIVRGQKTSENRNQLRLELLQSNLLLVRSRRCWMTGFGSRQRKEFEELTLQLKFQLKANISLLDSLMLIAQAQRSSGSTLASSLLANVSQGRHLSTVTAERPGVFGLLAPALLGVGERTGNLCDAVGEIHRSLVNARLSRQRLRQAIAYPVIVACSLVLVTLFMLFRVVPDLVALLINLNVELPWVTRMMHGLSNSVRDQVQWILVGSGVWLLVAGMLTQSPRIQLQIQRWQIRIPGYGTLLMEIRLARYCRALAILIDSGVNLLDSLATAEPVLEQEYLECEMRRSRGGRVGRCFSLQCCAPTGPDTTQPLSIAGDR